MNWQFNYGSTVETKWKILDIRSLPVPYTTLACLSVGGHTSFVLNKVVVKYNCLSKSGQFVQIPSKGVVGEFSAMPVASVPPLYIHRVNDGEDYSKVNVKDIFMGGGCSKWSGGSKTFTFYGRCRKYMKIADLKQGQTVKDLFGYMDPRGVTSTVLFGVLDHELLEDKRWVQSLSYNYYVTYLMYFTFANQNLLNKAAVGMVDDNNFLKLLKGGLSTDVNVSNFKIVANK